MAGPAFNGSVQDGMVVLQAGGLDYQGTFVNDGMAELRDEAGNAH